MPDRKRPAAAIALRRLSSRSVISVGISFLYSSAFSFTPDGSENSVFQARTASRMNWLLVHPVLRRKDSSSLNTFSDILTANLIVLLMASKLSMNNSYLSMKYDWCFVKHKKEIEENRTIPCALRLILS